MYFGCKKSKFMGGDLTAPHTNKWIVTASSSTGTWLIKHLPYCCTKRCPAAFIADLISVISSFQTSCTCPAAFKLHKFTQWSICHLMSHVTHLHQQCTHTMSPAAAAVVGPWHQPVSGTLQKMLHQICSGPSAFHCVLADHAYLEQAKKKKPCNFVSCKSMIQ